MINAAFILLSMGISAGWAGSQFSVTPGYDAWRDANKRQQLEAAQKKEADLKSEKEHKEGEEPKNKKEASAESSNKVAKTDFSDAVALE